MGMATKRPSPGARHGHRGVKRGYNRRTGRQACMQDEGTLRRRESHCQQRPLWRGDWVGRRTGCKCRQTLSASWGNGQKRPVRWASGSDGRSCGVHPSPHDEFCATRSCAAVSIPATRAPMCASADACRREAARAPVGSMDSLRRPASGMPVAAVAGLPVAAAVALLLGAGEVAADTAPCPG